MIKNFLAIFAVLALVACTTTGGEGLGNLTPEQQLQLGCKAVPVIVNDLALYRMRGKLSDETNATIEELQGPIAAVCRPGITDFVTAASALTGYLDTLLSIQKEVK